MEVKKYILVYRALDKHFISRVHLEAYSYQVGVSPTLLEQEILNSGSLTTVNTSTKTLAFAKKHGAKTIQIELRD